MSAAANYAFANRQMITHWVRETFENVLGIGRGKLGLGLVYDVCHNYRQVRRAPRSEAKRKNYASTVRERREPFRPAIP